MMTNPGYQALQVAVQRQGWRFFDSGEYNLNLVGVRSGERQAGQFDDSLFVAFRQAGIPVCLKFVMTSDPGTRYLSQPINPKGAAILARGQHRGLWQIGMHQGRYTALVQRGIATVHRDNNRDGQLDLDHAKLDPGYHGINLHHAGVPLADANVAASAGCQVLANKAEFDLVMALAQLGLRHGHTFTYTLLHEGDFL